MAASKANHARSVLKHFYKCHKEIYEQVMDNDLTVPLIDAR